VLPPREPEVLQLRPLTTAQGDEVGLFLPLEGDRVRQARFTDPEPASGGDATGIMTLFDAARLSLRSGAGPFRSLGRISVIPRPYQFVPLPCAVNSIIAAQKARKKISALRQSGRGMDLAGSKGTFWGVLNAVLEFVDHHQETNGSRVAYAFLGDGMDLKLRAFNEILKKAA
jgi:hypothetical protein